MPRRKSTLAGVPFKVTAPQTPDETRLQAAQRFALDTAERFSTLSDHFRIPRKDDGELDFFWIAFHLAREIIPAFRGKTTLPGIRGMPSEKDWILFSELHSAEIAGDSVSKKAKDLSKRPMFKGRSKAKEGAPEGDWLRKRYYEKLKNPKAHEAGKAPEAERLLLAAGWRAARKVLPPEIHDEIMGGRMPNGGLISRDRGFLLLMCRLVGTELPAK